MSGLSQYPAGSDAEVIAALRFALETRGWRPEDLEQRAGLMPGAVHALLSGQAESDPVLRKICIALHTSRWLFHLSGAVVVGAAVGFDELGTLLERRRGDDPERSGTDLVVDAVEILLAIGEDDTAIGHPDRSRRVLIEAFKRLSRRAEAADLPQIACLVDAVTAFVLLGVEDLALRQLKPALDLLDSARHGCDEPEAVSRLSTDAER